MEQVGDMKFIDFEDALDRDLGKVGTPKRDAFESGVDEAVYSYMHVKPTGKLVLTGQTVGEV